MTSEQRTLRRNAVLVGGFGLALAATMAPPLFPLAKVFLTMAHWPFHPAPDAAESTLRLMFAISGGLTVGLAAMMWVVASDVLLAAPQAGRKVVITAALAWFCTDSLFSVLAGAPTNAALNVVFLVLMLGAVKRDGWFTPASDEAHA